MINTTTKNMNREFNKQRKAALGLEEFGHGRHMLASSMLFSLTKESKRNDDDLMTQKKEMPNKTAAETESNMNHGAIGHVWGGAGGLAPNKTSALGLLAIQAEQNTEQQKAKQRQKESFSAHTSGRYHTPSRRGLSDRWNHQRKGYAVSADKNGLSSTHTRPRDYATEENRTVRVTGLSWETTEANLSALCGRYGRISRIYLARDRETNKSRGFAFVTYTRSSEAATALDSLDGERYDHRILHADWARPRQSQPARRTGYGGALPQTSGR